jgi:hypothetical protein
LDNLETQADNLDSRTNVVETRTDNVETRAGSLETRTTGVEGRTTAVETKSNDNATAIGKKVDTTVTGKTVLNGGIDLKGTTNGLTQTVALTDPVWQGIIKPETGTYSMAMGRFVGGSDKIELRSYMDSLTIRTGRQAGNTNSDLNLITNDTSTAGVSADINLQARGGSIKLNPNYIAGNGLNVNLNSASMPTITSQNTAISNIQLKFGSTTLQVRDAGDTVFQGMVASAFTVNSEREYKKGIRSFSDSVLNQIRETPVRKYKLNQDQDDDPERIGLIRDESPEQITKDDTIDLYQMCSMLWRAVQELTNKVEELSL